MSRQPYSERQDDLGALKPPIAEHLYGGRQATHHLHILIVGCGLGGLAAAHCLAQAGHDITILESESVLDEVGAGLQVSPNASRLLARWGLAEKLAEAAVEPQGVAFRRYKDGKLIGYSRRGAPNYHIHRVDLHKMLLGLVSASPRVRVLLNSTVMVVDPEHKPQVAVKLASGEVIAGDLIIGADGVKSIVRSIVVGRSGRVETSGDVAYRAVIPTDCMLDDSELKALIDTPEISAWMGPKRHMIGY